MSSCSTYTSSSTAAHGCPTSTSTPISTLHPDVIHTHILTRLDGPTLAAAACASSQLHALSTQDQLWREICTAIWPSITHPRVTQLISSFPSGHRSFFSDSFPVLDHRRPSKHSSDLSSTLATTELISCVDVYYKDVLILSKTRETETITGWFLCSPFRVDLLDPKESVSTTIRHGGEEDAWLKDLEENLSLSWILIDPERKRAVNLSSRRAISVERHWLTNEVQARFSLIMAGGDRGTDKEMVKWEAVVTCGGERELQVREVCMQVEDMEGRGLNGRDSLVILQEAVEKGRRKRVMMGNEGRVMYEEFVERKREIRLRKIKREKLLDMACIAVGIAIFVTFWCYILFR